MQPIKVNLSLSTWIAIVLTVVAILILAACTQRGPVMRQCDGSERIDTLLESGDCQALGDFLTACQDKHPGATDFAALNRLQDAATFCYVKAQDCQAAEAITPERPETRFHLAWTASCYDLKGDYDKAGRLAEKAFTFWNELYAKSDVEPPLLTCLSTEGLEKLPLDDQALHTAMCTAISAALKRNDPERVKTLMKQGKISDPNWRLLLYYHYIDDMKLDDAAEMLDSYLANDTCYAGKRASSAYTRSGWRRVCYPAIRNLAALGVCEQPAQIHDTLRSSSSANEDTGIFLSLANCYLGNGDTVNAGAYANRYRELMGDDQEVYSMFGYINMDEGNFAEARFYFELALDVARRNAEAKPDDIFIQTELAASLRMLAQVMIVAGDNEPAEPLVVEAAQIIDGLVEKSPDNGYLKLLQTYTSHFRQDLDRQVALFLDIGEMTPSLGVSDLVEAAALTGNHYLVVKWGDATLVANRYRPAVKLVLLVYLAISHVRCGNIDSAIDYTNQAKAILAKLPNGCAGWFFKSALAYAQANPAPNQTELAALLTQLDRCSNDRDASGIAAALEAYIEAAKKNPVNPEAAGCHMAPSQPEESTPAADPVTEPQPTDDASQPQASK